MSILSIFLYLLLLFLIIFCFLLLYNLKKTCYFYFQLIKKWAKSYNWSALVCHTWTTGFLKQMEKDCSLGVECPLNTLPTGGLRKYRPGEWKGYPSLPEKGGHCNLYKHLVWLKKFLCLSETKIGLCFLHYLRYMGLEANTGQWRWA